VANALSRTLSGIAEAGCGASWIPVVFTGSQAERVQAATRASALTPILTLRGVDIIVSPITPQGIVERRIRRSHSGDQHQPEGVARSDARDLAGGVLSVLRGHARLDL
jgi:hypothetical protein